jgi:hypothetical protein
MMGYRYGAWGEGSMAETDLMAAGADPVLTDRELDGLPSFRRRRGRGSPPREGPRLLANPFLALLGLIGWYTLMRYALVARRLDVFLPALASLALVVFLFQYHCLDCGTTGRLTRWQDHACRRPAAAGRRGWGWGWRWVPSPVVQTSWWFYLLGFGTILAYLARR